MIAIPAGFSPEDYLAIEHENALCHEYRLGATLNVMNQKITGHQRIGENCFGFR